MLPGLGLIRRFISLALMVFAFWAGLYVADLGHQDRCEKAGGTLRDDSLCGGLP